MPLTASDLSALNRLLDEALDLAPDDRGAWLEALSWSDAHLVDPLRQMLAQSLASVEAVIGALPRVGDESPAAHAGQRVGPYRLVREIGRGGMGSVWLAERADGAFERRVALKLPRLPWSPDLPTRMRRERQIGARLEHPHIAHLYDAGVDDAGRPYLAMEYIQGQPIDVHCAGRVMRVRDKVELFVQVVRAVAYAHGRLIIHRDLKPANVLVDVQGHAHLIDFGIARLLDPASENLTQTQDGAVAMTPAYASPEQILRLPVGVESDVYSLGAMLYELLAGVRNFAPKRLTPGAIEEAILEGDSTPPSARTKDRALARALRGDVDAIVGKAIRREPADRYATASAFADDLERYLAGAVVVARPHSVLYRAGRVVSRHRVGVAATTAVLLVALVGGAATFHEMRHTEEQAERARIVTQFVSEMFRVSTIPHPDGEPEGDSGNGGALAELIESRFADYPQVRSDLYAAVGRMYLDIGVDVLAARFARRQLDSLSAWAAPADVRARAHTLMAAALSRTGEPASARSEVGRALGIVPPWSDAWIEARLQMAATELNAPAGLGEADRIIAEMKASTWALQALPSMKRVELKVLEADSLLSREDLNAALPLYEDAASMAVAVQGPGSWRARQVRMKMANAAAGYSREAEAFRNYELAARGAAAGGDGSEIWFARDSIGFWLRVGGNLLRPHAQVLASIAKERGTLARFEAVLPSNLLADIDMSTGSIELSFGNTERGLGLVSEAVPRLLAQKQGRTGSQYARLLYQMANAQMLSGDHRAADRGFRERIELGYDDQEQSVHMAQNMIMAGDLPEAGRILARASALVHPESFGAMEPYVAQAVQRLKSRILLESGDAVGALAGLPGEEIVDDVARRNDNWFLLISIRGEALCALGRASEGERLLSDWIDEVAPSTSENDPAVARVRAIAGLCALKIGEPDKARQRQVDATLAFARQPGVSPWFKKPLKELDEALAVRARD